MQYLGIKLLSKDADRFKRCLYPLIYRYENTMKGNDNRNYKTQQLSYKQSNNQIKSLLCC